MRTLQCTVPAAFDSRPLKHLLRGELGISSTLLKTLKWREGAILLNGASVHVNAVVRTGDTVTVVLSERAPRETDVAPLDIPLAIVYEDEDLLVIDKPAGMIVHGDGTGERTLTDYASDLLLAMGDGFAANDMQPLNRLDRDTTGVVLFSLDKQTQPAFDQMVIDHAFEKHYLALAEGKIDWNEKLIDKPIARDRHDSRKMRVGASGKPSQTRVKVLKRLKSRRGLPTRSYIDVELLTGRKHQIRVHLASEHHPLVGDDLYGTPRPCGLMLHAHSVSFTHPVAGEPIHIEAPCPWEP